MGGECGVARGGETDLGGRVGRGLFNSESGWEVTVETECCEGSFGEG